MTAGKGDACSSEGAINTSDSRVETTLTSRSHSQFGESTADQCLQREAVRKRTPWLVPADQPLELLFFHKVFVRLRSSIGFRAGDEAFTYGVPLIAFQRAMSRLFHVLGEDDRCFNAKAYDANGDGTVGWWEFCMLWKVEQPSVRLSLPERIYLTLENPEMSRLGRIVSMMVLTTIIISAGGFILSTLPSMQEQPCEGCEPEPFPEFSTIDTICVILFTIEYLTRLVTSAFMRMELPISNQEQIIHIMCTDELIRWPTKIQRVWDFVRAPPNLIDLAAILPSYVAWCMPTRAPEDGGGGDSSMVILKLIRLMRVVRAFRLGRRFEAVIIIARSMHRSTRALWVLVLNMTIGTVIFGAVMFFVEQGTYDPYTQRYTRPGSWELNPDTQRYERAQEDSPFESIPHAFWWALVTATTAGYGDMSPTTLLGKVTAGICMIWSLCVIALPVGVIGSNFESVWEEYDQEKKAEREMLQNEARMKRNTVASIDPLSHSSLLYVEVYHDARLATPDNDTFIGETESIMMIDPSSTEPVEAQLALVLHGNPAKSDVRAKGKVHLAYSWTASEKTEPGDLLRGQLVITLLRAEDLAQVDWKTTSADSSKVEAWSDPYVILTLYPNSPSKDGILEPMSEQSTTVFDSRTPTWNEKLTFDFRWRQDGVLAKRDKSRRGFNSMGDEPPTQEAVDSTLDARLMDSLPQIAADLEEVQRGAPELQEELRELRQATRSIMATLGLAENDASLPACPDQRGSTTSATAPAKLGLTPRSTGGGAPAPAEAPGGRWAEEQQSQAGSRQPSPRPAQEVDADFQFVVPGMITEEPTGGAEEPDLVASPTGGA